MKRIAILAAAVSVVLLTAYGAITFYDEVNRFGRMWETPAVKPHEQPLLRMEAGVVPFGGGEMLYRTAVPDKLVPPLDLTRAETIDTGSELYTRYCIFCHGRNHDGMGTVGQSFAPLPGDLRSLAVQYRPPGRIFHEISFGIPEGRQPALATTIEVTDRWRIVAYVLSLGVRK